MKKPNPVHSPKWRNNSSTNATISLTTDTHHKSTKSSTNLNQKQRNKKWRKTKSLWRNCITAIYICVFWCDLSVSMIWWMRGSWRRMRSLLSLKIERFGRKCPILLGLIEGLCRENLSQGMDRKISFGILLDSFFWGFGVFGKGLILLGSRLMLLKLLGIRVSRIDTMIVSFSIIEFFLVAFSLLILCG